MPEARGCRSFYPKVRTLRYRRQSGVFARSSAGAGVYVGEFFFFQAEDGIRDYKVTGVQTCALPILQKPIWIWNGPERSPEVRTSSTSTPAMSWIPCNTRSIRTWLRSSASAMELARDRKSVV